MDFVEEKEKERMSQGGNADSEPHLHIEQEAARERETVDGLFNFALRNEPPVELQVDLKNLQAISS